MTKLIRDAFGGVIPQSMNTDGSFSVLANGDTSNIDFGQHKLLRDAFGSVLPYQYFDVDEGKFVPGTLSGGEGGAVQSVNGKSGFVNLTATDVGAVKQSDFLDYISQDTLNQYASDVDSNDIYRLVELKRADGTLYLTSTLTEPNANGDYLKCEWKYYNTTGMTVTKTVRWVLTYDSNGNITSKVVL
jgi:hypothetical protein